jgi:hypothetical protein
MKDEELLGGIRDGNYHAGGIRCLQLFRLENSYANELQAEVERLCRTEQGSNVSDPNHVTNWTRPRGTVFQFSLLNTSGSFNDTSADHDVTCFGKRFHASEKYPRLSELIASFPDTINFRLNVLGPRARLSPHEEHSVIRTAAGSVGIRARFHLPITTNPRADLMLDGSIYHLPANVIHFVNHGCVHSACNGGDENRIHIVWDMLLTRRVFDVMFADDVCAPMLVRIAESERQVTPLRVERIGAHLRLPPLVPRAEAEQIGFCDVQ